MLLGDEADARQHEIRAFARRCAEHAYRARGRSGETDREVQQGRLAGPVRTHEGGDTADGKLERAVPERPFPAVALA